MSALIAIKHLLSQGHERMKEKSVRQANTDSRPRKSSRQEKLVPDMMRRQSVSQSRWRRLA